VCVCVHNIDNARGDPEKVSCVTFIFRLAQLTHNKALLCRHTSSRSSSLMLLLEKKLRGFPRAVNTHAPFFFI
jgi:hypothetical protein